MTICISYSGVSVTPKWETLQRSIVEALDKPGRLTRISRDDGGCAYRDPGTYSLTFTPKEGDNVEVLLTVARCV